jgi:hypothetical protein
MAYPQLSFYLRIDVTARCSTDIAGPGTAQLLLRLCSLCKQDDRILDGSGNIDGLCCGLRSARSIAALFRKHMPWRNWSSMPVIAGCGFDFGNAAWDSALEDKTK